MKIPKKSHQKKTIGFRVHQEEFDILVKHNVDWTALLKAYVRKIIKKLEG